MQMEASVARSAIRLKPTLKRNQGETRKAAGSRHCSVQPVVYGEYIRAFRSILTIVRGRGLAKVRRFTVAAQESPTELSRMIQNDAR